MSNRSRPDFYTQKAKKEGYMARSVYKLEEIQNKNKLIQAGRQGTRRGRLTRAAGPSTASAFSRERALWWERTSSPWGSSRPKESSTSFRETSFSEDDAGMSSPPWVPSMSS